MSKNTTPPKTLMLKNTRGSKIFTNDLINIVITKNTSNTLPRITKYSILFTILITEQNNTITIEKYLEITNNNPNNSSRTKQP